MQQPEISIHPLIGRLHYEVFGAFFYEKNEMVKYRQKPLKTIILPESGRDVIELLVK